MKLSKIKYVYEILSVIVGAIILVMNFLFIAESLSSVFNVHLYFADQYPTEETNYGH